MTYSVAPNWVITDVTSVLNLLNKVFKFGLKQILSFVLEVFEILLTVWKKIKYFLCARKYYKFIKNTCTYFFNILFSWKKRIKNSSLTNNSLFLSWSICYAMQVINLFEFYLRIAYKVLRTCHHYDTSFKNLLNF